jgi:hypothetical protein
MIYKSGLGTSGDGNGDEDIHDTNDDEPNPIMRVEKVSKDEEDDGSLILRDGMTVTVPIYCVKYLARSKKHIPSAYIDYFE